MSDETTEPKKTRKANPLVAWKKAQAHTKKVRGAAEKAASLREKAKELEAQATALDSLHGTLDDAVAAERAAYETLQAELNGG